MINKLFIFHDNNGSFLDLTDNLNDWVRGTKSLDYVTAQDKLYLGRAKPFNTVWVEIATANTAAATLTLEYWNGTAWTALAVDLDDTQGFTRSGWIRWTTPDGSGASTAWDLTTVNLVSKFWLRLTWNATFSPACILNAIGLVFSDDSDLKERVFDIADRIPTGAVSHILSHVSAKKLILSRLETSGKLKFSQSDGIVRAVDEWDLFDVDSVRKASSYLTLSIIFDNLSDTADDIEDRRAKKFHDNYDTIFDSIIIPLDVNDDGFESPGEASNRLGNGEMTRF